MIEHIQKYKVIIMIALVAVGFVITAFLAALFASIAQQAHDQKAPLEQLEHH